MKYVCLDIEQQGAGLGCSRERKQMKWVLLEKCNFLSGSIFWNRAQGGRSPSRPRWAHWVEETEIKFRRSDTTGFVWQRTGVEGAVYRKSSRNLHRLNLLLITKEHMCRVAIHKAEQRAVGHCKLSNSWSRYGAEGHSRSHQPDRETSLSIQGT